MSPEKDERVVLIRKIAADRRDHSISLRRPRLTNSPFARVECHRAVRANDAADNVTIRKKFFFPKSTEKKDNFVAEMDVDLVNAAAIPTCTIRVILSRLVPLRRFIPKDYPYLYSTGLVHRWQSKGIDVNWFGGGGGLFGFGSTRSAAILPARSGQAPTGRR